MADYRKKGASSTGGRRRILSRFRFCGTPSNGPEAADQKRTNNSSNFDPTKTDQVAAHDHVCRPVIFGSDGKATPVLFDFPRCHPNVDGAYGSSKQAAAGNGVYRDETSRYWPTEYADRGRSSAGVFCRPEPTVINTGGWTRPSKAGWAMPLDVPLEKATNPRHMDTVMQPPATGSRHSYASKPTKSSAVAVIDSIEAARKYGGQFI